jgi:sulfofructose kinase
MRRAKLLSVGALTLDTILKEEVLPREQGKFVATDGMMIASGAAIKCTRFGGRLGVPDRAETEALIDAWPG